MKHIILKSILSISVLTLLFTLFAFEQSPKEFKGKATYISKSKMELGRWGARMSEAQKKQIKERLKNRLNKTYILNFNKEASVFEEKEKKTQFLVQQILGVIIFHVAYNIKMSKKMRLFKVKSFMVKGFS